MLRPSTNANRFVVRWALSALFVLWADRVAWSAPPAITPCTEEAQLRGLVYAMQDYPQQYGGYGFGCGFVDLDGDSDPDIVLVGAADGRVGLFENDGAGHFTDRSADSGIPLLGQGSAFVAADYDGDGDLDLYFTQVGLANVLVRNDGDFQFTDVTRQAGVGDLGAGKGACFGDFDGDSRLDLYICNYNGLVNGTERIDNKLFRNLGNGSFEDVSVKQSVNDHGRGFEAVWFDYDLDGDLDLYLSNDRGHLPPLFRGNQLWRNDSGQLVNVSEESGTGLALYSMGLACGDFDNNGWPDLYCTNIPGGGDMDNPLLLNQGNGSFIEASQKAGVENPITSWGAVFFDFDNNGHYDLYVNNMFQPNTLYLSDGTFPCIEVGAEANLTANTGVSYSSAVADVDDDGDLDVIVNNLAHNVELFINHEGNKRNWIRYQLLGLDGNLLGIGANVRTRTGTDWQLREIYAGGNGYLGQNELVIHVGVNNAPVADEVVIRWPGGTVMRTLTNLPTNETWTLYPPSRLGDADGDGAVTIQDFFVFANCFDSIITPGCEMMDFDGDSFIDLDDFDAFLDVYSDPLYDCNDNGQPDLLDILLNPALDLNGTGIPDTCEARGDLNGDGLVGALDLSLLLVAWGPCDGCPADLDADGTVGVPDLLILLGNWG